MTSGHRNRGTVTRGVTGEDGAEPGGQGHSLESLVIPEARRGSKDSLNRFWGGT